MSSAQQKASALARNLAKFLEENNAVIHIEPANGRDSLDIFLVTDEEKGYGFGDIALVDYGNCAIISPKTLAHHKNNNQNGKS